VTLDVDETMKHCDGLTWTSLVTLDVDEMVKPRDSWTVQLAAGAICPDVHGPSFAFA